MSFCKLYLDEDSSNVDLLFALRQRGVNVVTVIEAGLLRKSDQAQLLWAASVGRTIYTFNASDFYSLHKQFMLSGQNHAGIIIGAQQRYSIGEQLRRLLRIINNHAADSMINRVEFLSHW